MFRIKICVLVVFYGVLVFPHGLFKAGILHLTVLYGDHCSFSTQLMRKVAVPNPCMCRKCSRHVETGV